MSSADFNHPALDLTMPMPLVYTAMSKRLFYYRMQISTFALEKGCVPLNPFMVFDYFLNDKVERDTVRRANNSLVQRCDRLWVFGPISNGVLAEILIAHERNIPIDFYALSPDGVPNPYNNERSFLFEQQDLEGADFEEDVIDQKERLIQAIKKLGVHHED